MSLTLAQLQTLKAAIDATPAWAAYPNTQDGAFDLANQKINVPHSTFIVWKREVSRKEILQNGFDWTLLDNLSVGKARVWNDIFVDGIINPEKTNVRAGIEMVWTGAGGTFVTQRAVIYTHCKELAKEGEKLFAVGTGTDAQPATRTVVGDIPYLDVFAARNLT